MAHYVAMRARALALVAITVVAASSLWAVAGPVEQAGAAVPAGFTDQLVAAVSAPTAIAFTPDRRMLVTTQGGAVRVMQSGALLAGPAIDLSAQICSNSERGLLGVAVDPQFATNGFVYLYYSLKKSPACDASTVNRVSRFVMTGNALGGEVVLIDNVPSPAGNHNGGDLHFGKDGMLYVSVGDGGCDYAGGGCAGSNDAARDRHALVGKILRIDRNGNVPGDNPFLGTGTARCGAVGVVSAGLVCQETFAWGLRNPFRMAFDPNPPDTRFYVNDVGQSTWEEIDLGSPGADYGWNVREGHCATGSTTDCGPPPAGMTNPIFDYGRADGCRSITGGAFVPGGVWPAAFDGGYLFADFGCGTIFRLDATGGGGFTRTAFATGLGANSVTHLAFGPWRSTQALYYLTYASGGQVRRIVHPAGATVGDYDADGDAERGVFRPSTGAWHVEGASPTYLGLNGDVPVPADYDGDGDTDRAVYRPSTGAWYVQGAAGPVLWGLPEDKPVPADYDGDGDADIAVWRPSTGAWLVRGGGDPIPWGLSGDVPVAGDYDGDGRADPAVFRPAAGAWYLRSAPASPVYLGLGGDLPVPADYDGDGDIDVAVFRPPTGGWFVAGAAAAVYLGLSGDVPVPGDYDANADAEFAVFRPAVGGWYVDGGSTVFLGIDGDIPLLRPVASP